MMADNSVILRPTPGIAFLYPQSSDIHNASTMR